MGVEVPAELVDSLETTAREVRREILRHASVRGGEPPGGSLSAVELLATLLAHDLGIGPTTAVPGDGSQFVLGVADAAPALRATIRVLRGSARDEPAAPPFFDSSASGGGFALGEAVGRALDARLDARAGRVYAFLDEAASRSGGIWEALLVAAHHRLGNLVVVFDASGLDANGRVATSLGVEPLSEKLRAFGLRTAEIDGHDVRAILGALAEARRSTDAPTALVAHTVSGKGVSFMENAPEWRTRSPSEEEAGRALAGIDGARSEAPS
ncbi:MAG: transketolase [Thermoplasmata archaeon]